MNSKPSRLALAVLAAAFSGFHETPSGQRRRRARQETNPALASFERKLAAQRAAQMARLTAKRSAGTLTQREQRDLSRLQSPP